MDEKGNKLIQQASKVFMRYGIKSVNMDDMARHLGVSKKTLYLYVNDKEDLVSRAVSCFSNMEDCRMREISKQNLNAVDESLEIMKWVLNLLQHINPAVEYDMEKYHPEVHKELKEHRNRLVYDGMVLNLRKGKKEGLYRKDFNPEIIAKMYMSRLDAMFDQNLFPSAEWSLSDIYTETFIYHIRGIASSKGLEYLREKMKLKS
jgi:TetR/AcrR family transcriptional regulator, cholesterol catabolism regulator